MRKIFMILMVCFASHSIAQEHIRVPVNMLLQLKIPIQPDYASWKQWNMMPSLQDSTKIIRIDRSLKGYAPFIPMQDAPYYNSTQVKEIQIGLEKILNPDGYFATKDDFMKYYQEFLEKFVYRKTSESK